MLVIKGKSGSEIEPEPDDKTIQYEKENEDIPLAKQRYEICKGCEHLSKLKFCGQCGCFMPLKVRIESASCPIQKWKAHK